VREGNMELTKRVSSRHLKIVTLLKKQERMRSTISKLKEIR
jgi:chaperonin cofactor prefoldin